MHEKMARKTKYCKCRILPYPQNSREQIWKRAELGLSFNPTSRGVREIRLATSPANHFRLRRDKNSGLFNEALGQEATISRRDDYVVLRKRREKKEGGGGRGGGRRREKPYSLKPEPLSALFEYCVILHII